MRARRRLVVGLLGLALLGVTPAAAQVRIASVRIASEERFFRIEWQLERTDGRDTAIVGLLDNHYRYRLQRVQLQAQVFDAAGQLTHETLGPMGDIPAGGRTTFRLPLPAPGARYTVTVYAFEFGPGESP